MATYIMKNTNNDNLRKYIERELFNRTTLKDIDYHFEQSEAQYRILIDTIDTSSSKDSIDKLLTDRSFWIKDM